MNWILTLKIIAYWFVCFGIVYLWAVWDKADSNLNWFGYKRHTYLGALLSFMQWITIWVPIISIAGYLTYLFFKP